MSDAVEITVLIALIQQQNTDGGNKRLDDSGAGSAARVVRNALIARLVILIAGAYPAPRKGDMHLDEAARLLKNDNVTHQIFGSGDGKSNSPISKHIGLSAVPIIDYHGSNIFRDKYTAHLGEPKDIEAATYSDLFALESG